MSKSGRYSADRKKIEAVAAAKTVEVAECGTIFILTSNSYTITMPSVASAGNGWWCKFIVGADVATGAIIIDLNGSDTLAFAAAAAEDGGAVTVSGTAQINLVHTKAKKGDQIEMICDGSQWYATGIATLDEGQTST